jgi:hypothetical protein
MCLPHTVAVHLRPSIGEGKGRRGAEPFVEDAEARQPKVNLTRDVTGRRVPERTSEGAQLHRRCSSMALANWWIVRSSDRKCLVVDIEPTGKDKSVTKIGKEVLLTREEAEADVKRLSKQ